jgi:hypothetical protein
MMDTIHLKYDAVDFPNFDFIKLGASIPFPEPRTIWGKGAMECIYGKLSSLRFTFHNTYFTIKGSWAKYYNGNNVYPLTRAHLTKAVLDLSSMYKFPFERGKVTRIDFADTFEVEESVNAYFHLLTSCDNMYSNLTKNQLLFANSIKELAFYDKAQEIRKRNRHALYRYKGKNLLRYEMRLILKVKENLKLVEAPIELFFEKQYYDMIIRRWQEEYRAITKVHPKFYDILFQGTHKDIFDQLIPMGFQAYGEKEFSNDLELARKIKAISSAEKSRTLSGIDKLFKNAPIAPKPHPLLAELDDLILNYSYPP